MGWFSRTPREPPPPPKRRVYKLRRDILHLICQTARSEHPHEFGGMLRVQGDVISELMLVPGTISGPTHALFQFHMLPVDFSVKGTVHSHPGSIPEPSNADLELFRKHGTIHIIIAEPYTERTWRAFDGRGDPIKIDVVD